MVGWLKKYGYKNINIIDNKSDYPPLLEYYKNCGCKIIYMNKNYGHNVFYISKKFLFTRLFKFYILSDPDLAPVENLPADFVEQFLKIMLEYPKVCKVGFSLKIDDIPDEYNLKDVVIKFESGFWQKTLKHFTENYKIYYAPIDTTFTLDTPKIYPRPFTGIRTGYPYQVRHLPWYRIKNDNENENYLKSKLNTTGNYNGELTGEELLKRFNFSD